MLEKAAYEKDIYNGKAKEAFFIMPNEVTPFKCTRNH